MIFNNVSEPIIKYNSFFNTVNTFNIMYYFTSKTQLVKLNVGIRIIFISSFNHLTLVSNVNSFKIYIYINAKITKLWLGGRSEKTKHIFPDWTCCFCYICNLQNPSSITLYFVFSLKNFHILIQLVCIWFHKT